MESIRNAATTERISAHNKRKREKSKPCYKNSPAKRNCSELGLLPSTPEGILLFAEFSECNLVLKENQKKKKKREKETQKYCCFHHFLSSAQYEKAYGKQRNYCVAVEADRNLQSRCSQHKWEQLIRHWTKLHSQAFYILFFKVIQLAEKKQ